MDKMFSSETPEIQKEKPFLEDSILLVPFVRKISDEKT